MRSESQAELVIYQHGDHSVEVRLDTTQETVWLRQEQMSELFGLERSVITKHLRNIFREGELDEKSNVQNLHVAGSDKPVKFYNLDVVISVGYRVKSHEATRFRQWATRLLREHLTKGWTLNRQRFEENARELEAAMALVRKTAGSPAARRRGCMAIPRRARVLRTTTWCGPARSLSASPWWCVTSACWWRPSRARAPSPMTPFSLWRRALA